MAGGKWSSTTSSSTGDAESRSSHRGVLNGRYSSALLVHPSADRFVVSRSPHARNPKKKIEHSLMDLIGISQMAVRSIRHPTHAALGSMKTNAVGSKAGPHSPLIESAATSEEQAERQTAAATAHARERAGRLRLVAIGATINMEGRQGSRVSRCQSGRRFRRRGAFRVLSPLPLVSPARSPPLPTS